MFPHDQARANPESYGDYLKRRLKQKKRIEGDERPLSVIYDSVARRAGYNNWSLFLRNLPLMSPSRFEDVQFALFHALIPETEGGDLDFDEFWFDGAGD